jgi:hypothetical protein
MTHKYLGEVFGYDRNYRKSILRRVCPRKAWLRAFV